MARNIEYIYNNAGRMDGFVIRWDDDEVLWSSEDLQMSWES